MEAAVVAAIIGGAVTLIVCVVNNLVQSRRMRSQFAMEQDKTRALIEYKLEELTKRVDKHNNVIERTFVLEGKVTEMEHDIRDIKNKL